MLNLFDQVKNIAHGVQSITEWLGSGGVVVDQETAQKRANVCLTCPNNIPSIIVTEAVAMAIKRHLSVKNEVGLRVDGEKSLHSCSVCSCVLKLLIWEPQSNVTAQMTETEKAKLPAHCWKLTS